VGTGRYASKAVEKVATQLNVLRRAIRYFAKRENSLYSTAVAFFSNSKVVASSHLVSAVQITAIIDAPICIAQLANKSRNVFYGSCSDKLSLLIKKYKPVTLVLS